MTVRVSSLLHALRIQEGAPARRSSAWLQEYDGVSDYWVDSSHTEPGLGR